MSTFSSKLLDSFGLLIFEIFEKYLLCMMHAEFFDFVSLTTIDMFQTTFYQ